MSSLEDNPQSSSGSKNYFQNLQPVIQKGFGNAVIDLIDYTTSDLLPLGENYGSTILKLDATIRRNKSSLTETLHLVVKLPSTCERSLLNWSEVFAKEVFMFAEFVPAIQSLQKEMGIEDLLDPLPKYAGHRCSLDETSDKIDENSLLLMENLKVRGYYVADRQAGLNLEQSRLLILCLARFHALGVVLKRKRPSLFERAKTLSRTEGIHYDQFADSINAILCSFREHSCFAKHLRKIEACFEGQYKAGRIPEKQVSEPWATLIHADLWVNNVLFHKDETNGHNDDAKLIDFQCFLHDSPMIDLSNLLCASVDFGAMDKTDELLDLYYQTFVRTLEIMGCDTAVFTRQSFDEEMKRQSLSEFAWSTLAIQFCIYEGGESGKDADDVLDSVLKCEFSGVFKERLIKLVDLYEKMGWF